MYLYHCHNPQLISIKYITVQLLRFFNKTSLDSKVCLLAFSRPFNREWWILIIPSFPFNLNLFDQRIFIYLTSIAIPCSGPVCKAEGRPNWRTEQIWLPGCPEQNIAHSRRRDSLTSFACGAVAPTLHFCLHLPHLGSLQFVPSVAQIGTVRGGLHQALQLLPPVPAISERPAIGGNRYQLLGKGVV